MGNAESSSKVPAQSLIKEQKNKNNIGNNIKNNIKSVNNQSKNLSLNNNQNTQPVQNNKDIYSHKSKYETQVYETDKTDLSENLNSYQYFRPKIPDKNTDGQFGINSQIDNKYSPSVSQLYKSNLESRKQSFENRSSLINQNSNVDHIQYSYNPGQNQLNDNHQEKEKQANEVTMLRDDALDIRDTAFLTNIEKRIMIMNNIILDEIDPLDIKDKEKLRLPQLRKKYLLLRNIYHPDKKGSGSSEMFIQIVRAIKHHEFILKSAIVDKDYIELRKSYREFHETEKKKPIFSGNIKSIDNAKFNQLYEEHKFVDDYDDDGYANIMVDGGVREDIDIKKTIKSESDFNVAFDKQHQENGTDIVKYSVPEAINEHSYNIICEKKDDFSGKGGNLNYTDYKKAFELEKIDSNNVELNRNYKKYIRDRVNDKLELSEEQEKAMDEYNSKILTKELEHENNVKRYSDRISTYFSNNNMHFLE
tara:strand:- start:5298 stop:6725 length:1428 start_codon:yes stop_codon:yes gene_type:complete